jgi:predicted O-methyltransferase YrrM
VDVGGGSGLHLEAILSAAPDLRAVLFDRPTVVEQARARLRAAGVEQRCELVGGDFFVSVPSGADGYLLSRVVHDWDDRDAVRILATCAKAMTAGSRLLVVEAVLPERAHESPAAIWMDLLMLLMLGARERTLPEYERLFGEAGLILERVFPTSSPLGLSVLEAVPVGRS